MSTLWTALERLPDHRTKKGRRYDLASIVTLSLAATLSGANDLRAIFRWGRRLTPKGSGDARHQAPQGALSRDIPLCFSGDSGG